MHIAGQRGEAHLEQHQIGIRQLPAIQPRPAPALLPLQHILEMRKELRKPVPGVLFRLPLALLLLVLVAQHRRDGVVRVVRLVRQAVQDGQRQAVDVVEARPLGGREPVAGRDVLEDVGRLADGEVAVAEDGRREEGRVDFAAEVVRGPDLDVLDGFVGGGDGLVCVGYSGLLEGEADELAAAGDAGPVD